MSPACWCVKITALSGSVSSRTDISVSDIPGDTIEIFVSGPLAVCIDIPP